MNNNKESNDWVEKYHEYNKMVKITLIFSLIMFMVVVSEVFYDNFSELETFSLFLTATLLLIFFFIVGSKRAKTIEKINGLGIKV